MPKPRRTEPSRPAKKKPAPPTAKAKVAAKPAKPHKKTAVKPAKPPAKPTPAKAKTKPARPVTKPSAKVAVKTAAPVTAPSPKGKAAAAKPVQGPVVRPGPSAHELAVEAFERGFQALQQRQFSRAADLLASVVNGFPDEKEMQERARVYLSICARQAGGSNHGPKSYEERVNAATVAINRGAYDEALTWLRKLEADHGSSDHVHYMLSVVYTVTGDEPNALKHLRQSVELNPENRFLAGQDADLEPLRHAAGYAAAVDVAAAKLKAAAAVRRR